MSGKMSSISWLFAAHLFFQLFAMRVYGTDLGVLDKSDGEQERLRGIQADDADGGDDRERPALTPHVATILGLALGVNQSQINRTIDRVIDVHNGIDPDVTTVKTTAALPPLTETTVVVGTDEDEDEEEEDGDDRASRVRRNRRTVVS